MPVITPIGILLFEDRESTSSVIFFAGGVYNLTELVSRTVVDADMPDCKVLDTELEGIRR